MMGIALYTYRVVLNTLRVEDYGIYNVVGGLVSMFGLWNGSMSSATRKHSIASEAFCMNQVTFALQNIKIRLWQAVKILKGYWNFTTRSPKHVVFR